MNASDLYVVTTVFNARRWKSRYKLYRDFEKYVQDSGAKLLTVQVAFGERPFEVTSPGNPMNLQLRTSHEIWLKENSLNLGFARLPPDWKYAAWIDADVTFARPDWACETVHQLQHNPVVQMWSQAHDLGPDHESFQKFRSFAYCYRHGIPGPGRAGPYGYPHKEWHPGYAWAIRREAFDHLGGLIDFSILGSADRHMAMCLVGRGRDSVPVETNPGYLESVLIWEKRADACIRGHLGYVPGALYHGWHGRKKDRGYKERWEILREEHYDPELDLKRDWQGLWQLTDRSPRLRRACQDYFTQRNEDTVEL